MRRNPCPETVLTFRRAAYVIKETKRASKQHFISSINSETTAKQAWNKINSFRKTKDPKETYMLIDEQPVYSNDRKAESFATFFREKSVVQH